MEDPPAADTSEEEDTEEPPRAADTGHLDLDTDTAAPDPGTGPDTEALERDMARVPRSRGMAAQRCIAMAPWDSVPPSFARAPADPQGRAQGRPTNTRSAGRSHSPKRIGPGTV